MRGLHARILPLVLIATVQNAFARPSILLVVMDTTRADAVSAYGAVTETTPTVDALSREGLRYARAYANAPWTVPSHATLFTGLTPTRHGVGWRRPVMPATLRVLAEHLRAGGYRTAGISENPWVGSSTGLDRGFERFVNQPEADVAGLAAWLEEVRAPVFVFANFMDAHWPYATAADSDRQGGAQENQWLPDYFCNRSADPVAMKTLRRRYLQDVKAADAKLARLRDAVVKATGDELVTVVTSDHGEHFGEQHLVSHMFSLHDPLLHVPLIVHGLAGVAPTVVQEPVQLADVFVSMLRWAQLDVPADVTGRALPQMNGRWTVRPLVATFESPDGASAPDAAFVRLGLGQVALLRSRCSATDRVWGDMHAVIAYPWKLILFDRFEPLLYDMIRDPGERRSIEHRRPRIATAMARVVAGGTAARPTFEVDAALAADVERRLEALGGAEDVPFSGRLPVEPGAP